MRICLLSEGCYPYVAGGVSSWIQMLINGMPEHEFIIFTIGAELKQRGQFKYKVPENVIEIKEHFLDEFMIANQVKDQKIHISPEQKEAFIHLLLRETVDWKLLFDLFYKDIDANEFLSSDAFYSVIEEIANIRYPHVPFKDLFWSVRSMLVPLLNLIKSEVPEADIYHSVSTGYAGIVGALFRYRTGKPFIVTEHGIYSREREEEILKADWVVSYFKQIWIDFFSSTCRCAYEYADRIVSLFNGAQQIQVELGAEQSKCLVIPNGINMSRFEHIKELTDDSHPLTIGTITRVVPVKDIKTMIQSFSLVKEKRPDAKLCLLGPYDEDPEYYEECQNLIQELACRDIQFVGNVQIEDWIEQLDMVILTSISEGQPFVLLEALAAHRPVLATNVGSCKSIIEGEPDEFGAAGMVTSVMNPRSIAASIIKMAGDVPLMRYYAQQGYQRVKKYYQEQDFLNSYKNLYEKVNVEWQELDLN